MTWRIARAARGMWRRRARIWLLRSTWRVIERRRAARGMWTICTEPLIIEPEYCVSGSTPPQVVSGVSPPHGLGPAPEALALVTTRRLPSGVTDTAVGYQAVGMKPMTSRASTSTTAIAFSPANATYSAWPSGLTPRPIGLEPFGPLGTSVTSTVAATLSVVVSITETVSELALAV